MVRTRAKVTALLPVTARGEATRQRLLRAAEKAFGANGYHATSISDITRRARVAQGTFYLYFPGKEALFRELVDYLGRTVRRHLSRAIGGSRDRLEAERRGLEAFIAFVREHRDLYRIVLEAQIVDPPAYRRYYSEFARGYTQSLQQAARANEIRTADAAVIAWALMGIGHFAGLRYAVWEQRAPAAAEINALMDFVQRGLAAGTTS